MPQLREAGGESKPAVPFDAGELFKDMVVSEFICGRSMMAVLAAPNPQPKLDPAQNLLLVEHDDQEIEDSDSDEDDYIEPLSEDSAEQ